MRCSRTTISCWLSVVEHCFYMIFDSSCQSHMCVDQSATVLKAELIFCCPPHYFSMLLTIGDLNNAQIICFHFPPPLQRKNVFAFLLLHGLLHKLAFNSKSVMGLQFFEGFCWGTKLFSNLQEICQKKWTMMPHNVPNMQLIFCNNYCV